MTFIEPVMMGNDKLIILDQTLLPGEEHYLELDKAEDVCEAIRSLRVRGAPAIGVAAAIGIYACLHEVEITIHEGKNRQVRKMFEAVGCNVRELKRISMGSIYLSRLAEGHYRKLTKKEIEYLRNI
jgi:16S rRNA uridine-516 pseudouridylate synthase and related pseudouridylate synthases